MAISTCIGKVALEHFTFVWEIGVFSSCLLIYNADQIVCLFRVDLTL